MVRDAAATFALGLLLIAVGLVGTWGGEGPLSTTNRWWFLIPLGCICVVMLGKARRPLLALAAGVVIFVVDVLMGGSLGVMIALLDLIYSAALRVSAAALRRLGLAVAGCVVGGATLTFVASGSLQQSVYVGLLVFAVLGTPLWWGRSVRQQSALAALASARAQDLARLGELREQEVVHAERTRMAGDLHDALASHLSAIAIHAEAALSAPQASPADDPARAGTTRTEGRERQALTAIRSSSVAALREMRAMIDLLRTGDEGHTSPARLAEVASLAEGFRGDGMELSIALPDTTIELPAAVDQAAYRIVQESLANALKHGSHGPVDVTVAVNGPRLEIEVTNPAQPPPPDQSPTTSGVGLLTMRERAEALGGTFAAGPGDGAWRVHAALPVEET